MPWGWGIPCHGQVRGLWGQTAQVWIPGLWHTSFVAAANYCLAVLQVSVGYLEEEMRCSRHMKSTVFVIYQVLLCIWIYCSSFLHSVSLVSLFFFSCVSIHDSSAFLICLICLPHSSSLPSSLPQPRITCSVLQMNKVDFVRVSWVEHNLEEWYKDKKKKTWRKLMHKANGQCNLLIYNETNNCQADSVTWFLYLHIHLCRRVYLESHLF